jgi:hypothetical protein
MRDTIQPTFRHWFAFNPNQTDFCGVGDWYVMESATVIPDLRREEVKRLLESQFGGTAIWVTERRIQIPLRGIITARQSLRLIDELKRLFDYTAGPPEDGMRLDGEVWAPRRKTHRTGSLILKNFILRPSLTGILARG